MNWRVESGSGQLKFEQELYSIQTGRCSAGNWGQEIEIPTDNCQCVIIILLQLKF